VNIRRRNCVYIFSSKHSDRPMRVPVLPIFPTLNTLLAEVSYLALCISWSFHGCLICSLRQLWNYYKNTAGKKMRTLLAGYTIIGFASLYSPPVTSCPLRGLFSIGWQTKQLSCFPFQFPFFVFYFLPTEVASTCSPRLPIFLSGNNLMVIPLLKFSTQKKLWGVHSKGLEVYEQTVRGA